MSGRYVTKCVSAVGYELNSIADESGEVNLAHNSSYFDELPDIQLSIATLTFALYNCLAKSGSLAVIAFAANFFDSVIVADECDRAIPARRCCWLRETILQHGREGRRGRSGKGKMINSVNCIRPVWTWTLVWKMLIGWCGVIRPSTPDTAANRGCLLQVLYTCDRRENCYLKSVFTAVLWIFATLSRFAFRYRLFAKVYTFRRYKLISYM